MSKMGVFDTAYASSYDLLYSDKNYKKECGFLKKIFQHYGFKIKTILDLGCGTGAHALLLSRMGYKVAGIDRSSEMLSIAQEKADKLQLEVDFYKNSIQTANIGRKFDAVISMFAVMSYQIQNTDVALACEAARKHLKRGGCFIFDVWNGLAVMTEKPSQRIKEIRRGDYLMIRFAEPKLHTLSHTVEVHYRILTLKKDKLISVTVETHRMRFFYPQEIQYFLEVAGFSEIRFCPFLKPGNVLTESDWNMTVIAR
jgi:2-polyprenyl-3-methyl-5-hydroxy-6-metoxy-1,4-benzoquinol methylase